MKMNLVDSALPVEKGQDSFALIIEDIEKGKEKRETLRKFWIYAKTFLEGRFAHLAMQR